MVYELCLQHIFWKPWYLRASNAAIFQISVFVFTINCMLIRNMKILGRAIPKALKWYQWVPCWVLSIVRQVLASLLLTNITKLTLQHLQKWKSPKKSPIIINVCIHRRTVWKTGNHAKYVILLKIIISSIKSLKRMPAMANTERN